MANRQAPGWVNYERLEKVAAKIRKQDPSLTEEQAITRAAEANPDIVRDYHREAQEDVVSKRYG